MAGQRWISLSAAIARVTKAGIEAPRARLRLAVLDGDIQRRGGQTVPTTSGLAFAHADSVTNRVGPTGRLVAIGPTSEDDLDLADLESWTKMVCGKATSQGKKGGRPGKADWPAIAEAFRNEVRQRGLPDSLNVDGWQRQADVERWIAVMLQRDGVEVSERTLRTRAKQFLEGQ